MVGNWRDQPFRGRIGRTYRVSTPWWREPRAPVDVPDVVVVVLDDVGFAQFGCYGSQIETPTIDRLAARGLRYANFHVTALCSPTRASLLTGRNHHSVGMSCLSNFDNGFPGGRGEITHRAATIAEMVGAHGYNAYCVGKWHVAPTRELSAVGPYDQWPLGRGFDRFYGFLNAETDQWAPQLWYDNHRLDLQPPPGYHLSTDLVDRSLEFLADHLSAGPENPFLLYLAFGACHAPHQAPREAVERYAGRFDHGWDAVREEVLARQVASGLVPVATELAPRNPGVRPWSELSRDERRLFARMQEVFAGFLEHTDGELARLVTFLEEHNRLHNTVLLVLSDNGTSSEGGPLGSLNEYRSFAGLPESFEENLAAIDLLGGPLTHPHYATGWAQAGNTPLKHYKKHTFGGGIRAPLIVHWPARIADPGAIRRQFHFVADVVPTLLETIGIEAPDVYRGTPQLPVEGVSMAYTLDEPDAVSRKGTQYFEMLGNRGLWHEGWKAVTDHEPDGDFEADVWELYHLDQDFSECHNLAEKEPDRLRRLIELWWTEAGRYDVLPLDDRFQARVDAAPPSHQRRTFTFLPGTQALPAEASPDIYDRSFTFTAYVELDDDRTEGVLLAQGSRSGFSFFVKDNRLVFDLNLAGRHTILESKAPVPAGRCTLGLVMRKTGERQAHGTLLIDGEAAGESRFETFANRFGTNALQCGRNSPIAVSDLYQAPFAFSGRLEKVVVALGDDKSGPIDGGAFTSALATQ